MKNSLKNLLSEEKELLDEEEINKLINEELEELFDFSIVVSRLKNKKKEIS